VGDEGLPNRQMGSVNLKAIGVSARLTLITGGTNQSKRKEGQSVRLTKIRGIPP